MHDAVLRVPSHWENWRPHLKERHKVSMWFRLGGTKILMVDDDERIRDSMTLLFEEQECSFMAVGSSERALEELESQLFDIIILDYKLPGMDGLELLGRIQGTYPKAAKIFTSAFGSDGLYAEAKEAGAVGFIRKPLTEEKLQECFAEIDRLNKMAGHEVKEEAEQG
jgi:CheY-like chemotaxis protein